MARIIRYTLASMIGAFVAWGLLELTHAMPASDEPITYARTFLIGLVSGLFIGVMLGLAEALSGLSPREAGKCVLMGALVGAAGGVLGMTIGDAVYSAMLNLAGGSAIYGQHLPGNLPAEARLSATPSLFAFLLLLIGRGCGWALLGAGIGISSGLATGSTKKMNNGAIGGFIGGGLGGSVFEILKWLNMSGAANFPPAMVRFIAYMAAAGAIGLFIGFIEELTKKAWLLRLVGRNEGKEYTIFKPVTVLGRSEHVDIPIFSDPDVAERHATITARERRHYIEDLGSTYGTSVNGAKIADKHLLRDSDVIEVGKTKFLFHDKATASLGSGGGGYSGARIPTSSHVCQFCGAVKDANGNCDCSVGAAPSAPTPGPLPGAQSAPQQPAPPQPMSNSTQRISDPGPFGQTQPLQSQAAPQASGARFVATAGPYAGQTFVLKPGETQIGRDATKDIPLPLDNTVSRNHSRVAQEVTCFVVYDLGSTNGTHVNGTKISRHELVTGDVVQIGSTKFRFES